MLPELLSAPLLGCLFFTSDFFKRRLLSRLNFAQLAYLLIVDNGIFFFHRLKAKCEDTVNVPFEGRAESDSYGRRRRRRSIRQPRNITGQEDELVVVQQIHISDKFTFDDEEKDLTTASSSANLAPIGGCANLISIAVVCGSFLIAQVTLLFVCAFVVNNRRNRKDELIERAPSVSSTASRLYSRQPFNISWS